MTRSKSPKSKKKRNPALRILKWTLLLLFALLVVLHFITAPLVTFLVNKKGPAFLNTDVALGSFDLNLLRGSMKIGDLEIGQPEGYTGAPLLQLKGIHSIVPLRQARSADPITVRHLEVDRLALHLIADRNGVLNVTRLAAQDSATPPPEEKSPGAIPQFLLETLEVKEFSLRFQDLKADTDLTVTNLNVHLGGLNIAPSPENDTIPTVVLDALEVEGLRLVFVTGTNGVSETVPEEAPPAVAVQELDRAAEASSSPTAIWLKTIQIRDASLAMQDHRSRLDLELQELELDLTDFVLGSPGDAPECASLHARSQLRGVEASAPIEVQGKIDAMRETGIPTLAVTLDITGFELDTIKPVTKSDAVKTLGKGLDLKAWVQIHPEDESGEQALGGKWKVKTSAGVQMGDQVKGTTKTPELNLVQLLSQLLASSAFNSVANVAENVFEGSVETVAAVADTGKEAIVGAGKTLKSAGLGLGKTAKGLITLDLKEAKEGVMDTTVGTVSEAAHAVADTAGAAGSGVMDVAKTTAGKQEKDPWIEEIPQRAEKASEKAKNWLAETAGSPAP